MSQQVVPTKKKTRPPLSLSNGKIYRLVCNTTGKVYIGSTCDSLNSRLWYHRKDWNMYQRGLFHYITSYEIIRRGNYVIELLEDHPCTDRKILRERENHYMKLAGKNCVNKRNALNTHRRTRAKVAQPEDHASPNPSSSTADGESLASSVALQVDSQSIPSH